jgi:hypothetical protein
LEQALARIDPGLPLRQRLIAATEVVQRRVVDVWRVVSNLSPRLQEHARRPVSDSDALTALLAHEPELLRIEPRVAARMLRAMTMSLTHPMLAGEPSTPTEIVDVLLHGIGADPPSRDGRATAGTTP